MNSLTNANGQYVVMDDSGNWKSRWNTYDQAEVAIAEEDAMYSYWDRPNLWVYDLLTEEIV